MQKVLSLDNPSKRAATWPIASLSAGEEQAEAEIQECDEPAEALAKNDAELC